MTIDQQQPLHRPALGPNAEPCEQCGGSLANDQRYCLNCGTRRADARVDFIELLERSAVERATAGGTGASPPAEAAKGAAGAQPWWRSTAAAVGAAAALCAVLLGVGVLIGDRGSGGQQVAATQPQVIRVESGGTPATPQEQFTSDWPDGQTGFTVQLQVLPKDTTQVASVTQAKTDATSKGATEVGALDSDLFSSLDPGNYVIYNGVFEKRKQAQTALKKLKASFPEASVIEIKGDSGVGKGGDPNALSGKKKEATVGKEQLDQLQKLSPEQYQKKSQKLPDTTKLPGKAPPKDKKAPGGGKGGGEVIG